MKREGLSAKRLRFVEKYHACGGNATRAAAAAGYKSPRRQGSRLLKDPRVAEAIERRMQRASQAAGITRDGMVKHLWEEIHNGRAPWPARNQASRLLSELEGWLNPEKAVGEPMVIELHIGEGGK